MSNTVAVVSWPVDRFYWSVLDASGWRRAGELPAGLRSAFEEDVPEAGEDLHAICAPAGRERLIVCAARRNELSALDAEVLALAPEALPPCVEGDLDPGALNLLVGTFEPRSMRRARLRWHLVSAASLTLCCVLVAVGLERRTEYSRGLSREAREARIVLVAQVGSAATLDRLREDLAALRRSADASQRVQPPVDAAPGLVELLQRWPAEAKARPQSLSVSASSIGMSVLVEGDPTRFMAELGAPSGWTLEQPRLTSVEKLTRLDLRFTRAHREGVGQ